MRLAGDVTEGFSLARPRPLPRLAGTGSGWRPGTADHAAAPSPPLPLQRCSPWRGTPREAGPDPLPAGPGAPGAWAAMNGSERKQGAASTVPLISSQSSKASTPKLHPRSIRPVFLLDFSCHVRCNSSSSVQLRRVPPVGVKMAPAGLPSGLIDAGPLPWRRALPIGCAVPSADCPWEHPCPTLANLLQPLW